MKSQGIHYFLAFLSFVIAIGMACSGGSASPTQPPPPTAVPVQPTAAVQPTVAAAPTASTPSGSDLLTFTDKNKFFEIKVPADWTHSTDSGEHYYSDRFTSPDKHAVVENIAYDDGTPFTGSQNGQFALQLLHQYYSYTGKEGDIKVTEEKQQPDGSDRLTWVSKGGSYSGVSFFEIRNRTTFLMFTTEWDNDYQSQYSDTLDNVISSYQVP